MEFKVRLLVFQGQCSLRGASVGADFDLFKTFQIQNNINKTLRERGEMKSIIGLL